MSRVGKAPIAVPSGTEISVAQGVVSVKGPKGALSLPLGEGVEVVCGEGVVDVRLARESKRARAMWGLQRTLIANMVVGVSEGFRKHLRVSGVGYRAQAQGRTLRLNLGYSHEVLHALPEGVEVACPSPNEVVVEGIDKQKVGQTAAEIRAYRPPEPYKGKGVAYVGEFILRKEGKKK